MRHNVAELGLDVSQAMSAVSSLSVAPFRLDLLANSKLNELLILLSLCVKVSRNTTWKTWTWEPTWHYRQQSLDHFHHRKHETKIFSGKQRRSL